MARDRKKFLRLFLDELSKTNLSLNAFVVYRMVRFKANTSEVWDGSYRQLADVLPMSLDQVIRACGELEEHGDLEVTKRRGMGCTFKLLDHHTPPLPGIEVSGNPTPQCRETRHLSVGKPDTQRAKPDTGVGFSGVNAGSSSIVKDLRLKDVDVDALRLRIQERGFGSADLDQIFNHSPHQIEVAEAVTNRSAKGRVKNWRPYFLKALANGYQPERGVQTFTQAREASRLRIADAMAIEHAAAAESALAREVEAWLEEVGIETVQTMLADMPKCDRIRLGLNSPLNPFVQAYFFKQSKRNGDSVNTLTPKE